MTCSNGHVSYLGDDVHMYNNVYRGGFCIIGVVVITCGEFIFCDKFTRSRHLWG